MSEMAIFHQLTSSFWFPKVGLRFDPATGLADHTLTPYVLQADQDSRFRIAGKEIATSADGLRLIRAVRPWRTDWLSFGLTDDGWTRPGLAARVRVFGTPAAARSGPGSAASWA